ncbi:MAG: glycosyltransferase [Planctomycetes bacterium]|nr:glycosyltransferase [Planctomycetota bacterium]
MVLRICEMITELRPAGAERCVYELATRLPRGRFAVEVVALRGGAVAEALAAAGVPVHVIGVRGKLDLLRWRPLVRTLAAGRFDVLHTHLFHAGLLGAAAGRRAGIGRWVHSEHVVERRFRPWRFRWAARAGRRADRIVCVSQGVRADHQRRTGLDDGRYTVIHNGVDAARYASGGAGRAAWRGRWGLGDRDVAAVFVGRLDRQKGIAVLLAAFDLAAAEHGSLHMVLAGDGPQRAAVERWRAGSPAGGRVHLLGHVDDVPGVLAGGDLFVQPSLWEGFCLAAAEAMAAGLPVAATDVPGLNEVVAADTALLCPPGQAGALAAALAALAASADLRRRLGAAGRARVEARFTLDRFVGAHADLYEQVVQAEPVAGR